MFTLSINQFHTWLRHQLFYESKKGGKFIEQFFTFYLFVWRNFRLSFLFSRNNYVWFNLIAEYLRDFQAEIFCSMPLDGGDSRRGKTFESNTRKTYSGTCEFALANLFVLKENVRCACCQLDKRWDTVRLYRRFFSFRSTFVASFPTCAYKGKNFRSTHFPLYRILWKVFFRKKDELLIGVSDPPKLQKNTEELFS